MTIALSKCKCGGEPVEQTRGQMKPEDHHMQFARHGAAKQLMEDHGVGLPLKTFHEDAFDVEDLGPEHASDFRISCPDCGKATGWDRRDIEKFENRAPGDTRRVMVTRDGNMDAVRERWNDLVK
jgi:hypothetical protein